MVHERVWPFMVSCILLFLTACTYSNDEIIVSEIENDLSNIRLAFQDTGDTIRVFGNTQLGFELDFDNRDVKDYNAYLDDGLIDNAIRLTPSRNFISFNTNEYADGAYTLRLVFEIESGSTSLASKQGTEFITIEFTQEIFIDNTPVTGLQVVSSQIKDGALEIAWNKYRGFGFVSYVVDGNPPKTNANDTTLLLSNYAGGQTEVSLQIVAKGQSIVSSWNYSDNLNVNIIEAENQIQLSWDRTPYTSNFIDYEINLTDQALRTTSVETITNMDQTSTSLSIDRTLFPSTYELSGNISGNHWIDERVIGDLSFDFPRSGKIKKLVRTSDSEILVLIQNTAIDFDLLKYETNTGALLAEIQGGLIDVSNNGEAIIRYKDGIFSKISPDTFVPIESLPSPFSNLIQIILYRGDNKWFVQDRLPAAWATYYTYDFELQKITTIYEVQEIDFDLPFSFNAAKISDDGRYLYHYQNLQSARLIVFDLNVDRSVTYIEDAHFIPNTNRLLRFDEAELYTTDIDGSNRVNLGISRSDSDHIKSVNGDNFLLNKEQAGSMLYKFNANQPGSLQALTEHKGDLEYTISDNDLLATYGTSRLFLRTLE